MSILNLSSLTFFPNILILLVKKDSEEKKMLPAKKVWLLKKTRILRDPQRITPNFFSANMLGKVKMLQSNYRRFKGIQANICNGDRSASEDPNKVSNLSFY